MATKADLISYVSGRVRVGEESKKLVLLPAIEFDKEIQDDELLSSPESAIHAIKQQQRRLAVGMLANHKGRICNG